MTDYSIIFKKERRGGKKFESSKGGDAGRIGRGKERGWIFGKVGKKLGCFTVRVDCDLNDLIDSR